MTRDRVMWLSGFYCFMGTAAFARMYALKRFEPLPLAMVPFVGVPFLMAYQADLAWGNKVNRCKRWADTILLDDSYFFNQPLELPELLKSEYEEMRAHEEQELRALGKPIPPRWAQ
jgi:Uncharacterised conserved protein (DUF2368)